MTNSQTKALTSYRRRLKRQGMTRLEVHVHRDNAALIRSVARALNDPAQEAEVRALLHGHFADTGTHKLKDLLASAPLEGIELTRDRDLGRNGRL